MPSLLRRLRRLSLLAWFGVAAAALWSAGLAGFVAASGEFQVSMPRRQEPPAGEHDLAAAIFGPTVRASSFFADWGSHHHPLFALDGRDRPDLLEKWASDPRDAAPWFEVRWREARALDRVVIRHGGFVETAATTIRRYRIICLRGAGPGAAPGALTSAVSSSIDDNDKAVAVHPLPCADARGVRVELQRNPGDDVVRIYELEAWGR